jgi:hypothetical protein
MLENFDPNTIQDEGVRQAFLYMMNELEKAHAIIQEQAEVIKRQGDEINRLKGEQGKPNIKPNKPAHQLSSEKERRESKPHRKGSKQTEIRIDRVEVRKVNRQQLPEAHPVQRLRRSHRTGHSISHREYQVPQREILLAKPEADVSG